MADGSGRAKRSYRRICPSDDIVQTMVVDSRVESDAGNLIDSVSTAFTLSKETIGGCFLVEMRRVLPVGMASHFGDNRWCLLPICRYTVYREFFVLRCDQENILVTVHTFTELYVVYTGRMAKDV